MATVWKVWLRAFALLLALFGVVFALAAVPALDFGVRFFYDFVVWPIDGASDFDVQRKTAAILGAVMLGWSISMWGLIRAGERGDVHSWRALCASVLIWWLVDSAVSIAVGYPVNALSNTILVMLFFIPIVGSGMLRTGK